MTAALPGYRLELEAGTPLGPVLTGHRVRDHLPVRAQVHHGGAARIDELRRRLESARGLDEPALVLPLELVVDGVDLVVIEDIGSLVPVEVGPAMAVDDVVGLVHQLGVALGRAHEEGLVHGGVRPSAVVATTGGPGLRGLVVGGPTDDAITDLAYVDLAETGPPSAAGDVYSLTALVYRWLTGRDPLPGSPLTAPPGCPAERAETIAHAAAILSAGPDDRPSAAELSAALRPPPVPPADPVPAVDPVVELLRAMPPLTTRPAPRVRRHQRAGGRVGLRPLLLLAVVAVLATGLVWITRGAAGPVEAAARVSTSTQASAPPPTSTAAATSSALVVTDVHDTTQWAAYLGGLYAERAQAFTLPSADPLDAVFAPGSPALQADQAAVQQLVGTGGKLVGFAPHVDSVVAVDVATAGVSLRVVDRIPAYQEYDASGTPQSRPGRGPATVTISLQRYGDRWLITSAVRSA